VNRQSKFWLVAAGVVAVLLLGAVLIFGIRTVPRLPSLYEAGGPTITGSVAYVDLGRDECVRVLDVATGESHELYCADWLWLEGWDGDGNLRIQPSDVPDRVVVIDPATGAVIASGELAGEPPPLHASSLRATSRDGHATLTYTGSGTEITLIDVDGPRNYGFWDFGITRDEQYAWVCDSEDRLLVVALDGSGGPWLVADHVPEATWNG
jgi:hypothetical protein